MKAARRFTSCVVLGVLLAAPSLAYAQDLDACIAANEKATKMHQAGKLVEERAALALCAASSCPKPVRSSCQVRLVDINRAIPSIVFAARDGAGHDVSAVKVTVDGSQYADHLDGSGIVLNPGDHEFRFEIAGQAPVVKHFTLLRGEQDRRENLFLGASTPVDSASASFAGLAVPVGSGTLVIKATAPGKVSFDGGELGRTPFDPRVVPAGFHKLVVVFDEAGTVSKFVTVIAGQTTEVVVEPSASAVAYGNRKGSHFGVTASAIVFTGSHYQGGGGGIMPFFNYGVGPAFDFRAGVAFNVAGGDGPSWSIAPDISARFNMGSIFTMYLAARVGYDNIALPQQNGIGVDGGGSGLFLAGEVSPLTFRVGPRREYEVGYTFAVEIGDLSDPWFRNSLDVSYLFTQF